VDIQPCIRRINGKNESGYMVNGKFYKDLLEAIKAMIVPPKEVEDE